MSTDWANQTKLDDAHAERREAANLAQLFRAHDSLAFTRLAAYWVGVIDLEGQSTSLSANLRTSSLIRRCASESSKSMPHYSTDV